MTLIVERQNALYMCGKDLAKYKQLRNRVQRECKVCKERYYQRKVSSLKETNIHLFQKRMSTFDGESYGLSIFFRIQWYIEASFFLGVYERTVERYISNFW